MEGCSEIAQTRRWSCSEDEDGVSEIIGVVMLLAMVISILGVVVFALQPYVNDFDDNKNWSSARILTEQVQERISVVGSAPNGTGVAFTVPLVTSTLTGLGMVETWTIQADISGNDRIDIGLINATAFKLLSPNETVDKVVVINNGLHQSFNITGLGSEHSIDTNQSFGDELIIDAYDDADNIVHRLVRFRLSGLRMDTSLNTGIHSAAMVNDGLFSRMPNEAWVIEKFPPLNAAETMSGRNRIGIVLSDIRASSALPQGNSATLEIVSKGPITLFDGEARNLRFTYDNQLHEIFNPQYMEHWMGDHTVHLATGDTTDYHGFAPWGRSSGIDGIGFFPADETILLEIAIQRVEVS